MACRDCEWWEQTLPTIGRCYFPVPVWAMSEDAGINCNRTEAGDGEGCPQFKEREDGE